MKPIYLTCDYCHDLHELTEMHRCNEKKVDENKAKRAIEGKKMLDEIAASHSISCQTCRWEVPGAGLIDGRLACSLDASYSKPEHYCQCWEGK